MGSQPRPSSLIVWRISNHDGIGGQGGLTVSGRWHTRPKPILYCSDDAHTAYCEIMKHVGDEMFLPEGYQALEIAVPARAKIEAVDLQALHSDWAADYGDGVSASRRLGDEWLRSY